MLLSLLNPSHVQIPTSLQSLRYLFEAYVIATTNPTICRFVFSFCFFLYKYQIITSIIHKMDILHIQVRHVQNVVANIKSLVFLLQVVIILDISLGIKLFTCLKWVQRFMKKIVFRPPVIQSQSKYIQYIIFVDAHMFTCNNSHKI